MMQPKYLRRTSEKAGNVQETPSPGRDLPTLAMLSSCHPNKRCSPQAAEATEPRQSGGQSCERRLGFGTCHELHGIVSNHKTGKMNSLLRVRVHR